MLNIDIYKYEDLPKNSSSLLKWVWYFINPFKKKFFFLSLNRIVGTALALSTPVFINYLIDFINSDTFQTNQTYWYYYIFWIFIALCLSYVSSFLKKYDIFFRNDLKRRLTIFSTIHTLGLPLSWHENQGTWGKIQRILTARESFKWLISLFFNIVLKEGWRFVMIISILFFTATSYISMMFIIYIGIFILITYLKSHKIEEKTNIVNKYYEKVIWKTYEFASAIFTAKFFNLSNFIKNKARKVENEQMHKIFDMINAIYDKWICLNFYNWLMFLIISAVSFSFLINNSISIWVFIMVIWFVKDVQGSLSVVWDVQDKYIWYKSWFMLLTDVLKEDVENYDIAPYSNFPQKLDKIYFKNLSFWYLNKNILKNIDLEVNVGEKIALVGKSGAGKSTFIKLLMKQVTSNTWTICFNDIDIKNIKRDKLLKNISVVLQDTELFNVSIKDNILLNLNVTEKDKDKVLKQSLKFSYSDDFVNKMEKWADTIIGERWVKLSWWEKQRIWIARALARDSKIVVFDEATSSLDSKSEKIIHKGMWKMFHGKTAFIIAHRLSTIKDVDKIVVFKNWRIIEKGTFDDLIKIEWEFFRMWKLQKLD